MPRPTDGYAVSQSAVPSPGHARSLRPAAFPQRSKQLAVLMKQPLSPPQDFLTRPLTRRAKADILRERFGEAVRIERGEMAEWLMALVLKTSDTERYRRFESYSLRQIFGDIPKLAEGAPLLRV